MNWKELECTGIRCNHETLENHYIVFDRDIKHSQQQLLESLEEDYKEMRKKSKVDEVLKECDSEWHEGFLVGIERFEALIQSKKDNL